MLRTILIVFISCFFFSAVYTQANTGFSVYCTSNMDGTGKCTREDNGSSINCLIIPGGVIACRDFKKRKYSCVQYGLIVSSQSEFFCEIDNKNAISDALFEQGSDSGNNAKPMDSPNSDKVIHSTPNSPGGKMPPSYNEAF